MFCAHSSIKSYSDFCIQINKLPIYTHLFFSPLLIARLTSMYVASFMLLELYSTSTRLSMSSFFPMFFCSRLLWICCFKSVAFFILHFLHSTSHYLQLIGVMVTEKSSLVNLQFFKIFLYELFPLLLTPTM